MLSGFLLLGPVGSNRASRGEATDIALAALPEPDFGRKPADSRGFEDEHTFHVPCHGHQAPFTADIVEPA